MNCPFCNQLLFEDKVLSPLPSPPYKTAYCNNYNCGRYINVYGKPPPNINYLSKSPQTFNHWITPPIGSLFIPDNGEIPHDPYT